jgi:hypothetical protein
LTKLTVIGYKNITLGSTAANTNPAAKPAGFFVCGAGLSCQQHGSGRNAVPMGASAQVRRQWLGSQSAP